MNKQMKKKRCDSFFGMHFDFHARPDQTNIGEFCDYETIDLLLREVKPDYIHCASKGHPGISNYPTKYGTPAPEMKGDVLKMWRELTEKHGVALYAHHSGVLDCQVVSDHPDWAALNENGELSNQKWETSVFSPYVDKVLIPQLIEIATEYHLDGAWIDGDNWGTIEDYSECARRAYKEKTGRDLPAADDEEGRAKYREFCRDGFRDYVKHYCDEVHKAAPDFEIASNWMYTARAPERPYEGVAFLSGDYAQKNSMRTAFFEGRSMQNSKLPWDLMAWGFNENCTKELSQLCAEAAAVISLGGGFEVYNIQLVGTVQKWNIPLWKKLAEFCRAREATCHKAKPHHEGAVLFSPAAFYEHKKELFRGYSEVNDYVLGAKGLLYALLDAGYSTELLLKYQLDDMSDAELSQYKFIAVSDLDTIEDDTKARLEKYAKDGGCVVVCGVHAAKLFEDKLGVKAGELIGDTADPYTRGRLGMLKSPILSVTPTSAEVVLKCTDNYRTNDVEKYVFSTVNRDGKGAWIGVYSNYESYTDATNAGARDAIEDAISSFYPRKAVEKSTHEIQVVLTEKNGALNVNLINVSGHHASDRYANYDEIVPISDVKLSIACGKRSPTVTEIPSGRKLDYTYKDGRIELTLDKLEIHSVIVIK